MLAMILHHDAAAFELFAYSKNYSATNGHELREAVSAFCDAAVDTVTARLGDEPPRHVSMWTCLDKAGAADRGANTTFSPSSLHMTIVCQRPVTKALRCYVVANLTLFAPASFDRLSDGRATYRRWLAREVLAQWRQAWHRRPLSRSTPFDAHAWGYGDPAHVYGCGTDGSVAVTHELLPEPEERFVDLRLLLRKTADQAGRGAGNPQPSRDMSTSRALRLIGHRLPDGSADLSWDAVNDAFAYEADWFDPAEKEWRVLWTLEDDEAVPDKSGRIHYRDASPADSSGTYRVRALLRTAQHPDEICSESIVVARPRKADPPR